MHFPRSSKHGFFIKPKWQNESAFLTFSLSLFDSLKEALWRPQRGSLGKQTDFSHLLTKLYSKTFFFLSFCYLYLFSAFFLIFRFSLSPLHIYALWVNNYTGRIFVKKMKEKKNILHKLANSAFFQLFFCSFVQQFVLLQRLRNRHPKTKENF